MYIYSPYFCLSGCNWILMRILVPLCIHFHHRGVPGFVSHHPFSPNSLFSCLPTTKRCVDRHVKVPSPVSLSQSPSTSASLLCPDPPPSFHLSALGKLIVAQLPASILTPGVRCAGTRLYGLPFRECSNSLTYRCGSICDTPLARRQPERPWVMTA